MKKKKSPSLIKKKLPAKHKATPSGKMKATAIKTNGKLTKQAEAEARKAHDLYWKSYILGDIETLASLLDDHYTQIGSVENEVFFNKKDAVKFVKTTIDQVAGNVEMRNRITKAEPVDGFILFNELCDLYVLIEGIWTFYSKFRATSLMQKIANRWKMIHQHSSVPDFKAQEGENIAIEKISAENLQLRDAVKRRTVELEHKNRELAIEAAMEKVRVRSLAMQKPEELAEVAEVLRNEMGALGVEELETSSIYILDETKGTTECWYAIKDIRSKNKKLVTDHMTLRLNETWVGKQMQKFHRSKQTRTSILMQGENRKEWINYCAGKSSVLKGYYGGEIPERTYHLLKFSNGFMGAASPGEISQESWDLLQRATSVFSFAYKRFSDLQKAEAQTREAQIEVAVERVRAKALAMHKSDEIMNVAVTMRIELESLNIPGFSATTFTLRQDDGTIRLSDNTGAKLHEDGLWENTDIVFRLEKNNPGFYINRIWNSNEKYLVVEQDEYDLRITVDWIRQFDRPLADTIENYFKENRIKHAWHPAVQLTHGWLNLDFYTAPEPEIETILLKMGAAFDLAYKRFLDLQKAEAQAREAQIELGLERVRARAMVMQKSDELSELVDTVFKELIKLDFALTWCIINIIDESSMSNTVWAANPDITKAPESYHMLFEDYSFHHAMMKGWKERKTKLVYTLEGEEKRIYDDYLFSETEFKRTPKAAQVALRAMEKYVVSDSFSNFGGLQTVGDEPLSDANLDILSRFGKVFDLTYTRFNDLQKAEAQAREAQVEAALERVRSRSMAMHKSQELIQVVGGLDKEIQGLGIEINGTQIITDFNNLEEGVYSWFTTEGQDYLEKFHVPLFEHALNKRISEALQAGVDFYTDSYSRAEKNEYFKLLFKNSDFRTIPKERQDFVFSKPILIRANVLSKNSVLVFQRYFPKEFSEEEGDIFKRFGKVFEQTYTRFLDLQKAEAQAREAQIEAALERVRSRTMAMHKSEELRDVIEALYKQLVDLQLPVEHAGFILDYKEEDDMHIWFASKQVTPSEIKIPYFDSPHWNSFQVAKAQGESSFANKLNFEEKNKFYKDLFKWIPPLPDEAIESIFSRPGLIISTVLLENVGLYIENYSQTPFTDEENTLLNRFGKVFQQSYTRFLDLQKAEAQAREAQIEAALERVRSRSMGMHKSEELSAVAVVLFEQLRSLGGELWTCGFVLCESGRSYTEQWLSLPGQGLLPPYRVPVDMNDIFQKQYDAWARGDELFINEISGEDIKQHYQDMASIPALQSIFEKVKQLGIPTPTWQRDHYACFKQGILMVITTEPFEEVSLFVRFAKVFEQTYTRFLDLQKAEAQAREAQIEAALERVRSRSLAMHKSEELEEVILVVSEQLQQLQFKFDNVSFGFDTEQMGLNFWLASPQLSKPFLIKVPYIDNPAFNRPLQTRKNGVDFNTDILSREENLQFLQHMFDYSDLRHIPAESKSFLLGTPGFARSQSLMKNTILTVGNYTPAPYSQEQNAIIKRFGNVFEQAYVRFLDLQKAEEQAREAQIEAALEKVRSTSLAIHQSQELEKVVVVLFEKLKELEVPFDTTFIYFFDKPKKNIEAWVATKQLANPLKVYMPYEEEMANNPIIADLWYAFENGEDGLNKYYKGKEKDDYYRYEAKHNKSVIPEDITNFCIQAESWTTSFATEENSIMGFDSWSGQQIKEDEFKILKRFAKVFEQAYVRFLDLQKSEAQARESQIQLALERVRAKAMAMQHSGELREIAAAVHDQLLGLGFTSGFCSIVIMDRISGDMTWWMFFPGKEYPESYHMPFCEHPFYVAQLNRWKQGERYSVIEVSGEEKKSYDKYTFGQTEFKNIPIESQQFMMSFEKIIFSNAYMKHGAFSWGVEPIDDAHAAVLQRFASVFEQCYTRFLDLQKAEAQAREAKIEAALERVRAKTMAMHNSQDVGESVATLFDELVKLDVKTNRCGILIHNDPQFAEVWTAKSNANEKATLIIGKLEISMHPMLVGARASWANKEPFFSYELKDQDMINYYQSINNSKYYPTQFNLETLPAKEIHSNFHFSDGSLFAFTTEALPIESAAIFKRFTSVFGQTYRRYLDLQKAEAQVREATIEASLEKVRGKAMAMHTSNDLLSTAGVVFTELKRLGINSFRGGVALIDKESRLAKMYSATSSEEGATLSLSGTIILEGHPVLSKIGDFMVSQSDYFPVLKGELLESYITHVSEAFNSPLIKSQYDEWYGCFLPYSEGAFYVWSDKPYTEDEIKVLKRFRAIVDLTFRRYLELQRAEANALDAVRSASLDRVRAEIASMRTKQDLERITPLIWKELTTLGIPFVRCGVFIMDDEKQATHTFLSTPDGKGIAAFELPYDSTANLGEAVTAWRHHKKYVTHWIEKDFSILADTIFQQGVIATREQYLNTVPKEGIYLHFLPFLQGMLYVGNTTSLTDDNLNLIQSVADAFSTAYARYEDFNKIEFAKAQVEKTLSDLRLTQAQLVQSEKMASLGELTAGIAHEIQNPLNFVNNFSEVSTEMIKEIQDERRKTKDERDEELENDLLKDISENMVKINHHGKRAADIVKGMLQHSRSSSGVKEPTDINALADEYLRLAYHGLRAKDKSFNAKFETAFDESVGKVNVIPQDIGRVILNLITNAFYVVNERAKLNQPGYEPTVTISTHRSLSGPLPQGGREGWGEVLIKVKDNGNGIPQKILDKIFQPFFTTKPTGQGTGLGLSLSYDIVKTHGGELKVETREGEGSVFTILILV